MNLSDIANLTTKFFGEGENSKYNLINNTELIKLGDLIGGLNDVENIKAPNIVVVGTQSSGKSSVLNNLIGMDVLPTGKQMVTRTPLKVEIIRKHGEQGDSIVEIGDYTGGKWETSFRQQITYPNITENERQGITDAIEKETVKKAGNQKDVSENTIYLKIYSPNVSNFSFTDLPGLTAVACTDLGQPSNIKQKIEKLIENRANIENTIILGIFPGRSDLEADHGLEFIKKLDPSGERTIGILTKLDLMNDETDISKYLENKVSRDLQLKYGYFAVRNRNSKEKEVMTIEEGIERENKYFTNHPLYKQEKYSGRLGIQSVKQYLVTLLTTEIKRNLPFIKSSIDSELKTIQKQLRQLGTNIPETEEAKLTYIQSLLIRFCNNYSSSILQTGKNNDTGRNIRDIFIKFRKDIRENNVFENNQLITNETIDEIIKNSEGNHMSSPFPPVEIIERCLQNPDYRPIYSFYRIINECNVNITSELINCVNKLVAGSEISRFHHLHALIKSSSLQETIHPLSNISRDHLQDMIKMQETYIWTDDPIFAKNMEKFRQSDVDFMDNLRVLLKNYMDSISTHIQDYIPKAIMYYLVVKSTENLYANIHSNIINSKDDINKLLMEDKEIEKQRVKLMNQERELLEVQREMERILN